MPQGVDNRRKPDISLDAPFVKVPTNVKLNAVQRVRIMEARREKVAHYLRKGWTEARIAEELGVSPSLVHYDVTEVRAMWQASSIDAVAQSALLDLARLDFIIVGHLDRAADDAHSAEVVMRAISHKAQILGYNAGVTFDIELYIRKVVEASGFDADQGVEIASKIASSLKK